MLEEVAKTTYEHEADKVNTVEDGESNTIAWQVYSNVFPKG